MSVFFHLALHLVLSTSISIFPLASVFSLAKSRLDAGHIISWFMPCSPSLSDLEEDLGGRAEEVSGKIDRNVRQVFPIGMSERKLMEKLSCLGFAHVGEDSGGNERAAHLFDQKLFCSLSIDIQWRTNEGGMVTFIRGAGDPICL